MTEKERVELAARQAGYSAGIMSYATNYCGKIFMRFMKKGSVLELGPAEGVMTQQLYPLFSDDYTAVDAADFFIDSLKQRFPQLKGYSCLFEDFIPPKDKKYDNIILGHVLEHVQDPVNILKFLKGMLSTEGVLLAAVPNCHSLHRQLAVKMGLLKKEDELNATDIKNGHRRVYNYDLFRQHFLEAGFQIKKTGGYWLKTLSNNQINEFYTEQMNQAFFELGEEYPDIAAEIYIVANP